MFRFPLKIIKCALDLYEVDKQGHSKTNLNHVEMIS